jgi:hypothetical protein
VWNTSVHHTSTKIILIIYYLEDLRLVVGRFRASAAKWVRTALFWVITQRAVVMTQKSAILIRGEHLLLKKIHAFSNYVGTLQYFCSKTPKKVGHVVITYLLPLHWHESRCSTGLRYFRIQSQTKRICIKK